MALLNCVQRPEDPGGFGKGPAPADYGLASHGDSVDMGVQGAAAEALFWEDKCRALLRELEAAHGVSQVMVREYTAALRDKALESAEWQQRLAHSLSETESLEADKARALQQLHDNEERWQQERNELEREVLQQRETVDKLRTQLDDSTRESLRWRARAERAVRDLQETQDKARAAFVKLVARHRQLQQQLRQQQQQCQAVEMVDRAVDAADLAPRVVSRSRGVQCRPPRRHATTCTARPAPRRHRATVTDPADIAAHPEGGEGAAERPPPSAPEGGGGDALVPHGPAQPAVQPPEVAARAAPSENLMDVSVDRLDELLRPRAPDACPDTEHCGGVLQPERLQQQQNDELAAHPAAPDGEAPEDLEGVLTAVRAKLILALQSHLAQRSKRRRSLAEAQTETDSSLDERSRPCSETCRGRDIEDTSVSTGAGALVVLDTQALVGVESEHRQDRRGEGLQATRETQVSPADLSPENDMVVVSEQSVVFVDARCGRQDAGTMTTSSRLPEPGASAETRSLQLCRSALLSERHAVAALSRALVPPRRGTLRQRNLLKRLSRPPAPLPASAGGRGRGSAALGLRDWRRLRGRGPASWGPRDWRRLRGRVQRHIWPRTSLEDVAFPVGARAWRDTGAPPAVGQHLARIRKHCTRAARSRAALGLELSAARQRESRLSAELADGEEERRRARSHIEFLQRRLQQLIHCSAVTASDLAALRSVHAKLTEQQEAQVDPSPGHRGEDKGGRRADAGPPEQPPRDPHATDIDNDGPKKKKKKRRSRSESVPDEGGGDQGCDESCEGKWSEEQLDHTPTKLVEYIPDERELAEVDATVCRVVRGLRGCRGGCSAAGAECLHLLRAVPRLARMLLKERRRAASARAWPWASPAPAVPPNTPRDARAQQQQQQRLVMTSRECAARLQAQSLAHQRHLQAVRGEHHKHIQAVRAAHSQAVGRLVDQHALALVRARDQLRAELRAEVQRELRKDMRAVIARSTAALEALHQAELSSLTRSSADPGQRAPQCEEIDVRAAGLSGAKPCQLNEWLELHEVEVIMQAANLALHSMDTGAAGDNLFSQFKHKHNATPSKTTCI